MALASHVSSPKFQATSKPEKAKEEPEAKEKEAKAGPKVGLHSAYGSLEVKTTGSCLNMIQQGAGSTLAVFGRCSFGGDVDFPVLKHSRLEKGQTRKAKKGAIQLVKGHKPHSTSRFGLQTFSNPNSNAASRNPQIGWTNPMWALCPVLQLKPIDLLFFSCWCSVAHLPFAPCTTRCWWQLPRMWH